MSARRALEFLGGSFAVYLGVVACGSSSGGQKPVAENGGETASGGASRGGAPSTGGSDSAGFGFGGIPDPTPDAGAAEAGDGPGPTVCDCPPPPEPPEPYVPPEPLVVEAECDVRVGSNTSGLIYAVVPRPELPESRVALGIARLDFAEDPEGSPPGHRSWTSTIRLSDTEVSAYCGNYGSGASTLPSSVSFIFAR